MSSTARRKSARSLAMEELTGWFTGQDWAPFPFQKKVWRAWLAGDSGLVHATTGTGKTYAALGGPLLDALKKRQQKPGSGKTKRSRSRKCRLLWLTPLRALASDLSTAIQRPLDDLELDWLVETRTGDTTSTIRQRQASRLPEVLITTPESLSLLLARKNARELLSEVDTVIVDEWHELLSTKRGTQTELALARLRKWNEDLRVWGLSATIGNLSEAADVLVGANPLRPPQMVKGNAHKKYRIRSIIPETMERFPWSGHLGLKQLSQLLTEVEKGGTSLVFTNTRSQSELWYQAILKQRPDWAGTIALHHGSIDQDTRRWVEDAVKKGKLRCVVCTSSLDLGVDFTPVERVFQIGSPKGVARLMQRAGRSGHRPGETSEVVCVPTNALELVEVAAARRAVLSGNVESRSPQDKPLDVLIQHLCTIALGGGFEKTDLLHEVRQSWAYRNLTQQEFDWALDFATTGGESLRAYPEYSRLETPDGDNFALTDRKRARQHRLSIGTICGDGTLTVKYMKGARIGSVEESFVAKLKRGDLFHFAGKSLEFVSIDNMIVHVRRAKKTATTVPRWMGGRMPLSTELADAFLQELRQYHEGDRKSPELKAVSEILDLQEDWSALPSQDSLLIERVKSREGHHLFFYPFAGRLVHEGLSALVAHRLAQREPISFTMSVNDYGFELLSPQKIDLPDDPRELLFRLDTMADDIIHSMNAAEMARRQFRDIARISGLVFNGYPGQQRTTRQLQASTGLLFDVFSNYDPDNLLLHQSRREVLEQQLDQSRMRRTMERLLSNEVRIVYPPRLTPFAFPLFVDRLRQKLSTEQLKDRIARMSLVLEKAAS